MSLIKGIVVFKKYPDLKREVRLSIFDTTDTDRGNLSELELDSLSEIIEELETLISQNNPDNYLEWGVDLFSVLSYSQISKCRNDIEGIDLKDMSTFSLLLFLRELETFKKKYSDLTFLRNSIGKAFETIKNSPSAFKKWEDGFYYETQIDDVLVNLNLSEEDFDYSVAEYLDQV